MNRKYLQSLEDLKMAKYTPHQSLKYFEFGNLPEHVQVVVKPIHALAVKLDKSLPNGSEKSAGLRKLLEAKDCIIRAAIDAQQSTETVEATPSKKTVSEPKTGSKTGTTETEAPVKKKKTTKE